MSSIMRYISCVISSLNRSHARFLSLLRSYLQWDLISLVTSSLLRSLERVEISRRSFLLWDLSHETSSSRGMDLISHEIYLIVHEIYLMRSFISREILSLTRDAISHETLNEISTFNRSHAHMQISHLSIDLVLLWDHIPFEISASHLARPLVLIYLQGVLVSLTCSSCSHIARPLSVLLRSRERSALHHSSSQIIIIHVQYWSDGELGTWHPSFNAWRQAVSHCIVPLY